MNPSTRPRARRWWLCAVLLVCALLAQAGALFAIAHLAHAGFGPAAVHGPDVHFPLAQRVLVFFGTFGLSSAAAAVFFAFRELERAWVIALVWSCAFPCATVSCAYLYAAAIFAAWL